MPEPIAPMSSASRCGVSVADRIRPRLMIITHADGFPTPSARPTGPHGRHTASVIAAPGRNQGTVSSSALRVIRRAEEQQADREDRHASWT